jgi:hypothetical protein
MFRLAPRTFVPDQIDIFSMSHIIAGLQMVGGLGVCSVGTARFCRSLPASSPQCLGGPWKDTVFRGLLRNLLG